MTTVPRTSGVRAPRPRAGKVPRPRRPVDRGSVDLGRSAAPRAWPGWPDQPDQPDQGGGGEVTDRVLERLLEQVPDDVLDPVSGRVPGPGPVVVRRRLIPEPHLARTGAAAALGMLLMAALLGTVGGFALLWLATRMLVYLR